MGGLLIKVGGLDSSRRHAMQFMHGRTGAQFIESTRAMLVKS